MSVYAVERLRQIMDCTLAQQVHPLVTHAERIEQVERWMGDAASQEAYRRELVFMPLCALMGQAFALRHAANLSPAQWEAAQETLQYARANGLLPALETGLPATHGLITLMQITTFILDQYQYAKQVRFEANDVVLDCGACFGDVSVWALIRGASKVYAFEPNPHSFALLQQNAQRFAPENFPNGCMTPVPYAVGKENGLVQFSIDPNYIGKCALNPQGNITVPAVTIDSWCEREQVVPTFIKMDLEGGELNAIAGAAHVFATHKPRFAICLYHNLSDMWEIPHAIKQLCPAYTLWCKKSNLEGDFILFGRAE